MVCVNGQCDPQSEQPAEHPVLDANTSADATQAQPDLLSNSEKSGATDKTAGDLPAGSDTAPEQQVDPDTFLPCATGQCQSTTAGSSDKDETLGMAVDTQGNLYLVGYTNGAAKFGSLSTPEPQGREDLFVAKMKPDGTFDWVVTAGGPSTDKAQSVAVGPGGEIYVTGYFTQRATFGTTTLQRQRSNRTPFVAQLSPQGSFEWVVSATLKDPKLDRDEGHASGEAIAVDPSGAVYVAGRFSIGDVLFSVGTTTTRLKHQGQGTQRLQDHIFLTKLDAKGNYLWVRGFGVNAAVQDMAVAQDGNTYLTGTYQDDFCFIGDTSCDTLLPNAAEESLYVVHVDSSGSQVLWSQGTSKKKTKGQALALGPPGTGLLYLTGSFEKGAQFGTHSPASALDADIFVAQLDAKGSFAWVVPGGGSSSSNLGQSIVSDTQGQLFITGQFTGTLELGNTVQSKKRPDLFLTKFDPTSRKFVWGQVFGCQTSTTSAHLGLHQKTLYLSGSFLNACQFPGQSQATSPQGSWDSFVWWFTL